MSSRRTLILVGAIALGLIAALLLFNYVSGIEDRANNNAKRVDVYVAKTDIPRGTPGETAASDGAVGTAQIPQEFRPASAITTTDEIQKKVALFDIPQNTPIVQDMFVDPAQTQISFRERLKNPDHVAITVSVDEVKGVAGFLVPGDEVNLMVSPEAEGEGGGFSVSARYLYQKVQILAVGQSTLLSPGEQVQETSAGGTAPSTGNSGLITFNVPPEAAQWIASAQDSGGLYMTLVAEDYVPKALPEITESSTLPGESGQLTPYGPTGNQD
ncbi:MAG TPA: Flp pilus assembly protein CpaB [Acidimicrobiales bacterium]